MLIRTDSAAIKDQRDELPRIPKMAIARVTSSLLVTNIQPIANSEYPIRKATIAEVPIAGSAKGRSTFQKVLKYPAPSRKAASSSSLGTA